MIHSRNSRLYNKVHGLNVTSKHLDVLQRWAVHENIDNSNTLYVYIRKKSWLENLLQMNPAVTPMKNTVKYLELLTGIYIQIIKIANWEIRAINMIFS